MELEVVELEVALEVALELRLAPGATKTVSVTAWLVGEIWERIKLVVGAASVIEDPPPPLTTTSVDDESPVTVGSRSTKSVYGRVEHPKLYAVSSWPNMNAK